MSTRYRAEWLNNGYIRVYDYQCRWDGLYNADGTHRSGSLDNLKPSQVLELI